MTLPRTRNHLLFRLSALAATVALALAVGCAQGGGGGSSRTAGSGSTAGSGTTPATSGSQPPQGLWLKGDLHSHSAPYSQDADRQGGDPPATCIRLAEIAGLDFFCLTDHRTTAGLQDPGWLAGSATVTCIGGEEWGGDGHAGRLGITQAAPGIDGSLGAQTLHAQVQAVVDGTHAAGGIFIINHPMDGDDPWIWDIDGFDAIEVWNAFWVFPGWQITTEADLDRAAAGQGLPAVGQDVMPEARAAARHGGGVGGQDDGGLYLIEEFWNRGEEVALTGGGDRHMLLLPGQPTTYVYARSRAAADILDGIRAGRTFVSSAVDGPQAFLDADATGDGVYEAIPGSTVGLNQPVALRVRVVDAVGGRVDIVKNGLVFASFPVALADETFVVYDRPAAYAWYRADVFERTDLSSPSSYSFQLLSTSLGYLLGGGGWAGLQFLSLPLGFQVGLGTRIPTVVLPENYRRILNSSVRDPGYARGAITSPIFAR